jgi:hypothetical protein
MDFSSITASIDDEGAERFLDSPLAGAASLLLMEALVVMALCAMKRLTIVVFYGKDAEVRSCNMCFDPVCETPVSDKQS